MTAIRPSLLDGGNVRAARLRERRCIASNESLADDKLIRFVLGPGNVVVPDVAAKLPGRGAWVKANRAAVEQAVKKGAFARAFKTSVKPQPDLADQTAQFLAKRALELLGLARRAGALALGMEQVDASIRARPQRALIEASDGSADGRDKLQALHHGKWGRTAPVCGAFTQAELGMALGRAHVIHACFVQERLALAWVAEIDRLAGFRAVVPASWPQSWPCFGVGLGVADGGPPITGGAASAANDAVFDDETDTDAPG